MGFVETAGAQPLFVPGRRGGDADLLALSEGRTTLARYLSTLPADLNYTAPSDERPFQNVVLAGLLPDLRALFGLCAGLLFVVLLVPYATRSVRKQALSFAAWGLYFAGIGVAFMMYEVVLIRRLMVHLGYPQLALAVVLLALLLSAGAGAWATRLVRRRRPLGLPALLLAIAVVSLLVERLVDPLMARLAGGAIETRSAAAVGLIVVPGLLLGMPFAVGMQRVAAELKTGNAWMWGINGVASVVGGILVMITAMKLGLGAAASIVAAIYGGIGLVFALRELGPR
jgi:hypothetical protein